MSEYWVIAGVAPHHSLSSFSLYGRGTEVIITSVGPLPAFFVLTLSIVTYLFLSPYSDLAYLTKLGKRGPSPYEWPGA